MAALGVLFLAGYVIIADFAAFAQQAQLQLTVDGAPENPVLLDLKSWQVVCVAS